MRDRERAQENVTRLDLLRENDPRRTFTVSARLLALLNGGEEFDDLDAEFDTLKAVFDPIDGPYYEIEGQRLRGSGLLTGRQDQSARATLNRFLSRSIEKRRRDRLPRISNEPGTWTGVEMTLNAVETADADGVGFVFTDDDPIVGVDLDDCRDPESGTIEEWARDVISWLDSYAEVSPSGTGLHVIAEGELPEGRSGEDNVEMYETIRFFTVTGEQLDATPRQVKPRVDAIRGVHADYGQEESPVEDEGEPIERTKGGVDLEDDEIIERAQSAENGHRFEALFRGRTDGKDSNSEADMALCLHLAFWRGGDPSRMDALFR
jgi:hypothetical protein